MQRIRQTLLIWFAALTLALGGVGAVTALSTPESASAHTYVAGVSCGSSVSPSSGQIKIGYHYGSEPWHRFYWRAMTAGEYWTYCW